MSPFRLICTISCLTAVTFAPPSPLTSADPNHPQEFDDLRQTMLLRSGRSLASVDLRDHLSVLRKVTFDSRTVWPPAKRLPAGFDPKEILVLGKDPGLGVRALHAKGITGKGVRVAIIDQPLLRGHEEYKGRVASYTAIKCAGVKPQMHGAAVASLLVGQRCGVAPGASLYYWAEPSWKMDYRYRTEALRQILTFNEEHPPTERIKVVSVSMGFVRKHKNLPKWKDALEDARKAGLLVIHCSGNMVGIGCPLFEDVDDPAGYNVCYFLRGPKDLLLKGQLGVPIDNRTTASYEGKTDYIFWPDGGLSWAAPYLAGVVALGLQIDPTLDAETMQRWLYETGTIFRRGRIVSPRRFVEQVQKALRQRGLDTAP